MWLYFLGLFVHFLFILTTSDIFFQNYMSLGEWQCESRSGTARRLVFILADGLDENQLKTAAFGHVANAMHGQGSWGSVVGNSIVSQYTDNQALISGFTVDPFSSYLGRFIFQTDTIDNFLNRSNNVFYIGSSDVYDYIYKEFFKPWWTLFYPEWENSIVSNCSFSELSNSVVSQTEDLFSSSSTNETLKYLLKGNKTTFFIQLSFVAKSGQLLGFSSNYTSSAVHVLFSTVESIVSIVEDYYKNDKNTVYILCSNSRPEDGLRSNPLDQSFQGNSYPFVAWGPGIARNREKQIIRQVDVASLVAALLGLDQPSNSRGIIPLYLLNLSREKTAEERICNAMHLYNLALETESSVPFNLSNHVYSLEFMNNRLLSYLALKNYSDVHRIATALTDLSIKKIRFNESVFKTFVWYYTVITLFGWIFLICSEILPHRESFDNKSLISFSELKLRVASRLNTINNQMISAIRKKITTKSFKNDDSKTNERAFELRAVKEESYPLSPDVQEHINENIEVSTSNEIQIIQNENNERRKSIVKWKWLRGLSDIMFFISISFTCIIMFFLDWPPPVIYYMVTPVVLLWLFSYTMIDWVVFAKEYFLNMWKEITLYGIIYLLVSCLVIKGFSDGIGLEFGVILILQSLVYLQKSSWSIIITWLISGCLILIMANKGLWISSAPIEWGLVASIIVLILWNLYATFRLIPKGVDFAVSVALLWQDGMSLGCVLFTDAIHSAGHETPCTLKLLCWLSFVFIFLPTIHRQDSSAIVLNICMSLSVPFILLSTAFEPLLFLLLSNFMITWMLLEGYSDEGRTRRELNGEDARRALLFVYFCFLASKILGNTNSFLTANIHSVRCFLETIREPLVWVVLLMKPVIVYTMITSIFLIILISNGVKLVQGFNLVLLLFQLIAATLFFQINFNEFGYLSTSSLAAATQFFIINIFVLILLSVVLFCRYIYRLPTSKVL